MFSGSLHFPLNPGAFYLRATLPALFLLFFILKQGLTKLQKASLSSWGWPQTRILQSQTPKYWDYKREPPRQADLGLKENKI